MPSLQTARSACLTAGSWKRAWKPRRGIKSMTRLRIGVSICLAVSGAISLRADQTSFRRSYAISPHGRIRIENRYGDVCITTWERNEVRIEAVKSATDAGRLADASIVVDSTAEQLVVRTQYAGSESEAPASVEYRITVPRTA